MESSKAIANSIPLVSPSVPNTSNFSFHYSFDFAQQVLFPSNPLQPGPIYFLVPRQSQIFGIQAEGVQKQVNYIMDESVNFGKGPNVVISFLHHFFEHYGYGEKTALLHCDNCTGQKKNNYVLWYLAWRCIVGLHSSIQLSFLVAGHTKFSPDWGFGLIKRLYRRTSVSCINDIKNVVESSSVVNEACVVGDETGEVQVAVYDWASFLSQFFNKIRGITAYHQFFLSCATPGVVLLQKFCDSEQLEVNLMKHSTGTVRIPPGMPDPLNPPGLSDDRKAYLYRYIREFCDESVRDRVCPEPL